MSFVAWLARQQEALLAWWRGDLIIEVLDGDLLPATISKGKLIHLVDGGESWSAGLTCPCGCGEVIELMLLPNVRPRWELSIDHLNRPTLFPSVWRSTGCRSHFWIRNGHICWV